MIGIALKGIAHKSRFPLLFFILIVLILSGVWSVWAQDGVLPLPGAEENLSRAFTPVQQLDMFDVASGDRFGWTLALDGDYLLIGSPYIAAAGFAFIYERDESGNWIAGNDLIFGDDTANGDSFAASVALEGGTAVIGAPDHDTDETDEGAAYVFTRDDAGVWSEAQKLTLPGAAAAAHFGSSIDIDGDRMIVGASGVNTAYVYKRDASQIWQLETDLNIGQAVTDVAINSGRILIGTTVEAPAGAAHLYQFEAGSWAFVTMLTAADGAAGDEFGTKVNLQGNQAFVYAGLGNAADNYSGAIYTFAHNGTAWVQTQKIEPNDAASEDYFGQSFAVDGQTMAVGSFGDSGGFGSVYLFNWSGSDWAQQDKIPAVGGLFGYAVDLEAGVLVSGAPDTNTFKGRVYVYRDPALIPTSTPTMTNTPLPPTETSTPDPYSKLLVDGGFETGAVDWIIKGATGDQVKCNKEGKVFAYDGDCAWRFKGSVGENSKIQQVITGVTSTELKLSGYVNAAGVIDSQVKVVVAYVEPGLEKSKITVDVTSETGGVYVPLSNFQPVLIVPVAAAIDKIKVQVKNSSTSGKIYYDALSLLSK